MTSERATRSSFLRGLINSFVMKALSFSCLYQRSLSGGTSLFSFAILLSFVEMRCLGGHVMNLRRIQTRLTANLPALPGILVCLRWKNQGFLHAKVKHSGNERQHGLLFRRYPVAVFRLFRFYVIIARGIGCYWPFVLTVARHSTSRAHVVHRFVGGLLLKNDLPYSRE